MECLACIPCDAEGCGNVHSGTVQCLECRAYHYCSVSCQKKDKSTHKVKCAAIKSKSEDSLTTHAYTSLLLGCGSGINVDKNLSNIQATTIFHINRNRIFRTSNEKLEVCCICLEERGTNRFVLLLDQCGHTFCLNCIVQWQRYQGAAPTFVENGASNWVDPVLLLGVVSSSASMQSQTNILPVVQRKCPMCRADVDDIELRLLQCAQNFLNKSKYGTISRNEKLTLIQEAYIITSALIQVKDPVLQSFQVRAEALLGLGKSKDAVEVVEKLIEIDRDRQKAMQENPVLSWIEHARVSYESLDYQQTMLGLVAASQNASRTSVPLKPPPYLQGSERTRIYQCALLIKAKAYLQQNEWLKAMSLFKKLLRAHQECQTVVASENQRLSTDNTSDINKLENNEHDDAMMAQVWKGLSVCTYELGAYAGSADAASRAIAIDRTMVGVHKYKAMSLVRLATMEEAIDGLQTQQALVTMRQALAYEAPWDSENMEENRKLYHEISLLK